MAPRLPKRMTKGEAQVDKERGAPPKGKRIFKGNLISAQSPSKLLGMLKLPVGIPLSFSGGGRLYWARSSGDSKNKNRAPPYNQIPSSYFSPSTKGRII